MSTSLTHKIVWQKNEPDVTERAITFWNKEADEDGSSDIQGRENGIVVITFNDDDKIVGVLLAEKKYSEKLGCDMYYTTARINKAHHKGAIRKILREEAFDCLQKYNKSLPEHECAGILMEIESMDARQEKRPAEWGGYHYIGTSERNLPARVRYFNGARVGPWK